MAQRGGKEEEKEEKEEEEEKENSNKLGFDEELVLRTARVVV